MKNIQIRKSFKLVFYSFLIGLICIFSANRNTIILDNFPVAIEAQEDELIVKVH